MDAWDASDAILGVHADEGKATVRVYPPEQALHRARPLPARKNLVIEYVSDDASAAFQEALTEA